jgi:hypothetical protein
LQSGHGIGIACVAVALAALVACATGESYSQASVDFPPPPAGQGRIMLYMTTASAQQHFFPIMTVDSAPVVTLHPGTFFYVDRPPGMHQIGVTQQQASVITTQIATDPITIEVFPGATTYVSASAVAIVAQTQVVLRGVPPDDATRDLWNLSLAQPEPAE